MLAEGQLALLGLWCCQGGHPRSAAHLTAFPHQGLSHQHRSPGTWPGNNALSEFGRNALGDWGAGNFQRKSSSCWTSSVSLPACCGSLHFKDLALPLPTHLQTARVSSGQGASQNKCACERSGERISTHVPIQFCISTHL